MRLNVTKVAQTGKGSASWDVLTPGDTKAVLWATTNISGGKNSSATVIYIHIVYVELTGPDAWGER